MVKKNSNDNAKQNKFIAESKRKSAFQAFVTFLFWAFVISTTIALLLFSDGYSVSLDERKITQNGAISVNSNPEGAYVYLNGKKRGQTPLTLPSVKPGYHKLEIVKDGFTTWSSEIYLQKRRAVEVNATLFRDTAEIDQLSVKNIMQIYPVQKEDELIFTVNNGDGSISIFHRPFHFFFWDISREETLITSLTTDKFTISPSPRGNFLLITSESDLLSIPPVRSETEKSFYYITPTLKDSDLVELTALNSLNNIKKVSWPINSDSKLLVETETQLFSYDTQSNQVILLLSYSKDTQPVYTTTNSNNIAYIDPASKIPNIMSIEGTNKRTLLSAANSTVLLEGPTALIAQEDENFFILQDQNKFVYFNNPNLLNTKQSLKEILLNTNASKITLGKISPDQKWIFYRDENKNLSTYNLEDLNKILQTGVERNFILLKADLIEDGQQFTWHPNSKNILTIPIRKNGTAAVKSINVNNQNIHTLLKTSIASKKFGISRDGDKLVFLINELEEQRLYELDLLDNQIIKIGLLE